MPLLFTIAAVVCILVQAAIRSPRIALPVAAALSFLAQWLAAIYVSHPIVEPSQLTVVWLILGDALLLTVTFVAFRYFRGRAAQQLQHKGPGEQ
jgi:hypothetical protein